MLICVPFGVSSSSSFLNASSKYIFPLRSEYRVVGTALTQRSCPARVHRCDMQQNAEKRKMSTRDGNVVNGYTNGQEITVNGQYILTATDKAGNETVVEFTIEKEELDDTITSSDYEP